MRITQIPRLLFTLLTILLSSNISHAVPLPQDERSVNQQNHTLELRDCAVPCGWNSFLCCASGQQCLTVAGQATCGAAAATGYANGQWLMFTTTYTQTDLVTVTTVYSSYIPIPTPAYTPIVQTQVVTTVVQTAAPAQTAICNANLGQSPCGTFCCTRDQFCAYAGQCQAIGGSSSNGNGYVVPPTSGSAFIRPTSATTATVIFTGTATTTIPFQTPIGTDGSALTGVTAMAQNNGLSGGAIAGIVIGVLLAIFLLFLFCACCLAKELFDSILGIFGLGKKARRRRVTDTTIISEHHSRHSGGRVTGGGRTWFGASAGPSRPQQKKSSGWGGALGVAGALGALALLLGLKRRNKADEKSSYGTGSSYTYSSYSSESSESSDRRTRNTRGSRR
ncbi:hypothetical protein MMC30_000890 [Trapelia coarctata]|nr:hypothetical protein [Trapelia coarctata]